MTENEAIKILKYYDEQPEFLSKDAPADCAFKMAIQALEEIQQIKEIISDFPLDCGSPVEDVREIYRQFKEHVKIGTIEEFKALKEMTVTQMDIDTFKAYIDDCMDDVAFGNTDWNHSLALVLKCMELHKT